MDSKEQYIKMSIGNVNIIWLSLNPDRHVVQEFSFVFSMEPLYTPKIKDEWSPGYKSDIGDEAPTITIKGMEALLSQANPSYQSLTSFVGALVYYPPVKKITKGTGAQSAAGMEGIWEVRAEYGEIIFTYVGELELLSTYLPCKFAVNDFFTLSPEKGMGQLTVSTDLFHDVCDGLVDVEEAVVVYEKRFAPHINHFQAMAPVAFKGDELRFSWDVDGDGYIKTGVYRGQEIVAGDESTGVRITEDTLFTLRADNAYVDAKTIKVLCTLWKQFANEVSRDSDVPPVIEGSTVNENTRLFQWGETAGDKRYLLYLHPVLWLITEVLEDGIQKIKWTRYAENDKANPNERFFLADMCDEYVYVVSTDNLSSKNTDVRVPVMECHIETKVWRRSDQNRVKTLNGAAFTVNTTRQLLCTLRSSGMSVYSFDKQALRFTLFSVVPLAEDVAPSTIIALDAAYYKGRTYIAVLSTDKKAKIYRLNDRDTSSYCTINGIDNINTHNYDANWIQLVSTANVLFALINGVLYECEHGKRCGTYCVCEPDQKPVLGSDGYNIMGIFPGNVFYKYWEERVNG